MEQPTILNMKMTPAGVDLCVAALRKLPHETVDGLIQDLLTQGRAEIDRLEAEKKMGIDQPAE